MYNKKVILQCLVKYRILLHSSLSLIQYGFLQDEDSTNKIHILQNTVE